MLTWFASCCPSCLNSTFPARRNQYEEGTEESSTHPRSGYSSPHVPALLLGCVDVSDGAVLDGNAIYLPCFRHGMIGSGGINRKVFVDALCRYGQANSKERKEQELSPRWNLTKRRWMVKLFVKSHVSNSPCSIQLLAREKEERRREQKEHHHAEPRRLAHLRHEFFAEGEDLRRPRQEERTRQPMRHVLAQLRILQQIEENCHQAEDAARRDEPARIERAGADFALRAALLPGSTLDQPAQQPAREHRHRRGDGNVRAHGERQRPDAQNLNRDHEEHAEEHE